MKKNNYMKPLCSMVEVRSELHLLSVSNEGEYRPETDKCGNIQNATSIDELIKVVRVKVTLVMKLVLLHFHLVSNS